MGFRFRRSLRILPGVRVNLSARGVSTTIGPRGASVNVSKRGAYLNTGIPGTGLSARTKLADGTIADAPAALPDEPPTSAALSSSAISPIAIGFVLFVL